MLRGTTLDVLRQAAQPLTDGEAGDYDALLKLIDDARVVLLGVSSYGTHELFHARAEVTKRLIQDRGFTTVALGANAMARPIDDFVSGRSPGVLASDALEDLTHFPRWLWRNAEMLDFLGWLRNFNDQFSGEAHKVAVCGVDLDRPHNTVIWEHSRSVGDTRATDRADTTSLGQLARERHGRRAVLITFSTHSGSVVVADGEHQPPLRQRLKPPAVDSVEALCHAIEMPRFFLPIRGALEPVQAVLREPRPERMIDAVCAPGSDGEAATYVRARLADQFDALVYFDETRSLEPLDPSRAR
jgi:erythromycin esterase-like protein